jgi:hypothetical protein
MLFWIHVADLISGVFSFFLHMICLSLKHPSHLIVFGLGTTLSFDNDRLHSSVVVSEKEWLQPGKAEDGCPPTAI